MALPDTSVQFFDSTMLNAPVLSGQVGTLTALLTACLVDGFTALTVTSLVVAGNVATVTTSGAHGLALVGLTGPVVNIAGATPAGLNGRFRVASVPSSTVFTLTTEGISDQTATGTITARRAGLGWSRPFSATNQAVYQPDPLFTSHCLQVIDDASVTTSAAGRWAKWRGYEAMTAVDTGTGLFPTAAQSATGLQVVKSNTSDSTARAWWLVGDAGLFYFGTFWHNSYLDQASGYAFGHTGSLRAADAFATLISANSAANMTLPSYPGSSEFTYIGTATATQAGRYLARSQNQIGAAVAAGLVRGYEGQLYMGYSGFAYPYPVNNGLLFSGLGLAETSLIRARAIPGLYYPWHNAPLPHGAALDSLDGLAGRTLRCQALAYSSAAAQCLIDITGPWARG